ncbi:DUF6444 domain-containing protein [Frankia sp. Cr2]|uniref:DUF6444 domain-containing protein n=1 Tax=Frankia sp. Cr2 TaxID=3073932 RepID=UPI002AD3C087|nr:DUF6444 domain-containing protein [Frankia sp. Cr2]
MDSSGQPTYEQLLALLADRDATVATQADLITRQAGLIEALAGRVAERERQAGKDSSTSSRPPSSDSPYTKAAPKRSSRGQSGRAKGKQHDDPGQTRKMVGDPDETVVHDPPACAGCGASLAGAPVFGVRRHQVFDVPPPPPRPRVVEHRVVARTCTGCGATTAGDGAGQESTIAGSCRAWPSWRHIQPRSVNNRHLWITADDGLWPPVAAIQDRQLFVAMYAFRLDPRT